MSTNDSSNNADPVFSIVIPAFNEEVGISNTLSDLLNKTQSLNAEIIVVDDGSVDSTSMKVSQVSQVRLIQHRMNRGYGSALVTGIRAAQGQYVLWYDADGQHRPEDLVNLAVMLSDNDLDYCIGVRDKASHQVTSRQLGKLILYYAVRIAARGPVSDFNSGLRGFRRDIIIRYLHLLPTGFSASTTTTLLMLERGYLGAEIPITTQERVGKSSVKQVRDGARTLMLILRIFLLFKPLLFFGAIGFTLIVVGTVYGLHIALTRGLGFPVLGALMIILGIQNIVFRPAQRSN